MLKNKIVRVAFLLMVAVQLAVPAKMVYDNEMIMREGRLYKFKTAPIDPNDPFRGKYISLQFSENTFRIPEKTFWKRGETVYALLKNNEEGFVKIDGVSKIVPSGDIDYVKATVGFIYENEPRSLEIEYPFDRFYMEESKAPEAELAYSRVRVDTTQRAYALVAIKNGNAVLKDVLLNEVSIREVVLKNRK